MPWTWTRSAMTWLGSYSRPWNPPTFRYGSVGATEPGCLPRACAPQPSRLGATNNTGSCEGLFPTFQAAAVFLVAWSEQVRCLDHETMHRSSRTVVGFIQDGSFRQRVASMGRDRLSRLVPG